MLYWALVFLLLPLLRGFLALPVLWLQAGGIAKIYFSYSS